MRTASSGHPVLRRRARTTAIVVAVVAALVMALYQPWLSQWGSSGAERHGQVVGDSLVANADVTWTRAITINAPPEQVWPWLVQMGQDRAGFYNFDWGEQLVGDPIHNATTIHPEWQSLAVGDVVHPKPGGDWTVLVLEPNRALVLANPLVTPTDWTWATELRPVGEDRTRLVTRIRNRKGSAFSYALDVPDLILFPRLLTGIKQRAEGTLPGMPGTHVGAPFPLARMPVHWWAALVWIVGLAGAAWTLRRPLGLGAWRAPRRHPYLTFWTGFVVGAGYLLMSDTPPVHFFTHGWLLGTVVVLAVAVMLLRRRPMSGLDVRHRPVARVITAMVETGLFVLLPATAVWQAATGLGWTTSLMASAAVASIGVVAATGIGSLAWAATSAGKGEGAVCAAMIAAAYLVSGSGVAALLVAVLLELTPSLFSPKTPGQSAGWAGPASRVRTAL